jgi:hypothetical protein
MFGSVCWVESTMVWARTGLPSRYSTVTWLFESGPSSGSRPEWRASAISRRMRCAYWIGAGISSGVSLQA